MRPLHVLLILAFLWGAPGCQRQAPPIPDARQRFAGIELSVVIADDLDLERWLQGERGEWSAETGGQLRMEPRGNAAAGGAVDSAAGEDDPIGADADIVIYRSTSTGRFVARPGLAEIPDAVLDAAPYDRKGLARAVDDVLMSWARRRVAFPLSAACELVYYRRDLLADEAVRERFEAAYGRPLEPPRTWSDFDQLAEFFAKSAAGGHEPAKGIALSDPGRALLARAAAYGKHPDNFSFYFDVQSMEPLATEPPFEQALEEWARLGSFLAPSDPAEPSLVAFEQGRAALAVASSSLAAGLLRADSPVHGKVGFVRLPGSDRAYDHGKRRWDERGAASGNHASVVEGILASVVRTSKHADAAFDFLAFLTNAERSSSGITASAGRLGPYRRNQFASVPAWLAAGWSPADTDSYLDAVRASLADRNAVAILRIGGSDEYARALATRVQAAFRGERPAADALQGVADAWGSITAERGASAQQRQYRESLGLPIIEPR